MFDYKFKVPEQKRIRMIVHTDCKNEADDQYALAHHLMTPKFDVRGIIAGHFDMGQKRYPKGETAKASYDEVKGTLRPCDENPRYISFVCGIWKMLDLSFRMVAIWKLHVKITSVFCLFTGKYRKWPSV